MSIPGKEVSKAQIVKAKFLSVFRKKKKKSRKEYEIKKSFWNVLNNEDVYLYRGGSR